MPLVQPSLLILQAFRSGLLDLADPNDQALTLLHGVQEGHQIYTLSLRDILTGAGLGAATLAGWQFVASNGANFAAAYVASTQGDPSPSVSSVSSSLLDTAIKSLVQAIQTGGIHPDFQQLGSELRLLKIPSVLVEAVWLKPALGDGDLIAPYRTVSKGIDLMRWYPARDFLNLLKPLATKFLVFETVSAVKSKP